MQPSALRLTKTHLQRLVNTRGRRISENLQKRALIYIKAFEWRNSLISTSPSVFKCDLCSETYPVGRRMYFIQNWTDVNASPNPCRHRLCAYCHHSVWAERPHLDDDNRRTRPVVSKNRTCCLWCRQPGRYL